MRQCLRERKSRRASRSRADGLGRRGYANVFRVSMLSLLALAVAAINALYEIPNEEGGYRFSSTVQGNGRTQLPIAAVVRPLRRRYSHSKDRDEEF